MSSLVATLVLLGFFGGAALAESSASGGFDFMPLLNLGAIGFVLAWFLWKADPRMRAIESAVDRLADAVLILLLEIDRTTPQAKAQAEVLQDKIRVARRARGEPEEQK